jgi:alpha-tubulin suppressor-like RCC1 family protein
MKSIISLITVGLVLMLSGCQQDIPPGEAGYVDPNAAPPSNNGGGTGTTGGGTTGGGSTNGGGGTGGTNPGGGNGGGTTAGILVFLSTTAQSVTAGSCSSPETVKSEKITDDSALAVTTDTFLPLISTSGHMTFYSDGECSTQISAAKLAAGTSTVSFYFMDNKAENTSFSISGTNYSLIKKSEVITASQASTLTVTQQPSIGGIINQPFSIEPAVVLTDSFGNTLTAASGAVTATPFSDPICQTPALSNLSGNSANLAGGQAAFSNLKYEGTDSIYIGFNYQGIAACSNLVTMYSLLTISQTIINLDPHQSFNMIPLVGGGLPPYNFRLLSTGSISPQVTQGGDYTSGDNPIPGAVEDEILITDSLNQTALLNFRVFTDLQMSAANLIIVGNSNEQINVTGGEAPYTYSVSNGAGSITQAGFFTAPTAAGISTVTVTDNLGTSQSIILTITAPLSVTPTVVSVIESGIDQQLVAAGGISPYTFSLLSGIGTVTADGDYSPPSNSGNAVILLQDSAIPPNTLQIPVTVSSGPATSITMTQQPGNGNAGSPIVGLPILNAINDNSEIDIGFNQAVTATVYDSNCQGLVPGVTATIAPPNFINGIYNGTSVIVNTAGTYTLLFTSGGFSVCSNPITINAVTTLLIAGGNDNCYINNQQVKCWGDNSLGQLAVNPNTTGTEYSFSSVLINSLTTQTSTAILSASDTCVLDSGQYKCWGSNASGQFGISSITTTQSFSPLTSSTVSSSGTVSNIAASNSASCALLNDELSCWGDDSFHQLGRGIPDGAPVGSCAVITDLTSCSNVDGCDTKSDSCASFGDPTNCQNNGCAWDADSGQCSLPGATTNVAIGSCGQISSLSVCPTISGCDTLSDTCSGVSDPDTCASDGCSWDSNNLICTLTTSDSCVGTTAQVCSVINDQPTCGSISACFWNSGSCIVNPSIASTNTDSCVGTSPDTCADIDDQATCQAVPSCGWNGSCYNPNANFNGIGNFAPNTVANNSDGVTLVAGGGNTFCAVTNSQLYCWGDNSSNQCGSPTGAVPIPTLVDGLPSGGTYSSVGIGATHACSVVNGFVYCWGNDADGQLGNNFFTSATSSSPQLISSLNTVTKIVSTNYSNCALTQGGAVYCWGRGSDGQLGLSNDYTSVDVPTAIPTLQSGVSDITAGESHVCAVMSNSSLKCWGDNTFGQLNAFVKTSYDTTAVTSNLGTSGSISDFDMAPGMVCSVSAGAISCVGSNVNFEISGTHQLGEVFSTPQAISLLNTLGVSKIKIGAGGLCSITPSGNVSCIGYSANGTVGDGSPVILTDQYNKTPVAIFGFTNGVTDISHGTSQSCGVFNGAAYCWGLNTNGALGIGDPSDSTSSSIPVAISSLSSGVTEIRVVGPNNVCAIVNGAAYCWGAGAKFLTGSGTNQDQRQPNLLSLSAGVTEIEGSANRVCAIQSGAVFCWGFDELGGGSANGATAPQAISSLTSAISISVGSEHSCAVLSDHSVWCWGKNNKGQLGISKTVTESLTPVKVSGITATKVRTAGDSTCALTTTGSLSCWGDNSFSQLGDGSVIRSDTPLSVTVQ